ncbi:MAG: DUF126 domain-containing protein [Desulfatirhabdiaceae bacterium]
MEKKIVLKGITRTTGRAEGEALVSEMPISWAPCSVLNDGTITMPDHPLTGLNVKDKIIVYPTVTGSTSGAFGLLFKIKGTKKGPAGIICRDLHTIDLSGALAGDIPSVDGMEQDPIETIKTGDWVKIEAPEIGKQATVTITRKE